MPHFDDEWQDHEQYFQVLQKLFCLMTSSLCTPGGGVGRPESALWGPLPEVRSCCFILISARNFYVTTSVTAPLTPTSSPLALGFVIFFFPPIDLIRPQLNFVLDLFSDLLFNAYSTLYHKPVFHSLSRLKVFILNNALISESVSAVRPGFPFNLAGIHPIFVTNWMIYHQPSRPRSHSRESHTGQM